MKKNFTFFSVIALLFLLALPAASAYKIKCAIPSDICLTQNKNLKINLGGFVKADAENSSFFKNGSLTLTCPENKSYTVDLKLFGVVPVKSVKVSAAADKSICPSGQAIGIKLYTDGVSVIAVSKNSPADKANIVCADVITHVNDEKIFNAVHFSTLINAGKGKETKITFVRSGKKEEVVLTPVYQNGEYVIGAWVRDSSAGVGTLTYVNALDNSFGALGHAICDNDTQLILPLMQGSITKCNIIDTVKGEKGLPGRLCATLDNSDTGEIIKNCSLGIYGKTDLKQITTASPMPIATRYEIHEGEATILASVDENGPAKYSAVIEKVNTADMRGSSMIIKVTDKRLLEKTGGIVQGMSGAPILQDGKFAGAVTHVFLNDPTRGYGVFIELMLNEAEKN